MALLVKQSCQVLLSQRGYATEVQHSCHKNQGLFHTEDFLIENFIYSQDSSLLGTRFGQKKNE